MLSLAVRTATTMVLLLVLIVAVTDCQSSPQAKVKSGVLSFNDTEVTMALNEIEEHFGAKIVSYGKLDKKVTATLRNPDMAQALTSVTSPFGYRWRKVTLAVKEGEEVSAGKLRAVVTALEKLDSGAAIVENPIENTLLAFKRNPDAADELVRQTPPAGEVYKTYYFVYNPKPNIVFAPSQPPKGQRTQGGYEPSTMEGLMDWFAQLDRQAQSRLLGQLMGSMVGGGMGAVSLTIDAGEAGIGEGSAVFIHRLHVDEGGED